MWLQSKMCRSEIPKLRWQCRRGLLELDILLTRFLETRYHNASQEEQHHFKALLNCSDGELIAWLIERAPPEEDFASLITQILLIPNSPLEGS